jgi:hypothetical protein
MEDMASRYADRAVSSVFLYTREAHPGELHPHVASFEEKLSNAREMAERAHIKRAMLVDNLEGSVHRAYGILPNMTYIVARRGRIVYRAAWTDPRTVRWMLDQMIHGQQSARDGHRLLPYYLEAEIGKVADRKPFIEALRTYAGVRAVDEYISAVAEVFGEGTAKPLRTLRGGDE